MCKSCCPFLLSLSLSPRILACWSVHLMKVQVAFQTHLLICKCTGSKFGIWSTARVSDGVRTPPPFPLNECRLCARWPRRGSQVLAQFTSGHVYAQRELGGLQQHSAESCSLRACGHLTSTDTGVKTNPICSIAYECAACVGFSTRTL